MTREETAQMLIRIDAEEVQQLRAEGAFAEGHGLPRVGALLLSLANRYEDGITAEEAQMISEAEPLPRSVRPKLTRFIEGKP